MASSLMLCMSTVIITLLIGLSVTNVSATCASPQYAEYGHQGIIKCNFMAGFTGVFWYLHVKPGYQFVIRMEKQEDGSVVRSGDGYTEGKYDMLSNGSLIISNISSYHNQTFKVVHVNENLHVEELYVELLATVFPDPVFPSINVCSKTNLCLVETIDSGILTCSYNHSKPPVELAWYRLSHDGTEKFHGETITTEDGDWTFSSVSKIDISNHINGPLIAFSCRASSPAISSQFLESVVIMDTTKQPWPSLQENVKEEKYFLINSEARVPCIDVTIPRIFVWKELQRNASEVIGFSANGNIRVVSRKTTRWTISHDGALIFSKAHFEDEGLYRCTLLDGTKYVANVEQVKASVLPQPPTIIVNDCPLDKQKCEILMRDPSSPLSISCYLNDVYPNVTLNMETFGTDLRTISQTTYPAGRENLYNAIITKELLPIGCSTSLNLTCYISKPVSLKLVPEKVILVLSEECKETQSKVAAIVVPIVIITLIICSVTVVLLFYRNHRNNFCGQKDVEDENMKSSNAKMEFQPSESEKLTSTPSDGAEQDESEHEDESNGSKPEKDISQISHIKEDTETEATGEESKLLSGASEDSHSKQNSERKYESNGSEPEEDTAHNSHVKESAETEHEDKSNGSKPEKDISQISHVKGDAETEATGEESKLFSGASEDSHSKQVGEKRQDILRLLDKISTLIMSYQIIYRDSKEVFDKDAITIVRDNPVNIQLKKDVGTIAKVAGGTLSIAGAALALFTFGFGAVLAIAGAAVGLTGVGIGLSSKELFEDSSKWQKVKPVFLSLIELLTTIAQTIAIACTAHETIENIRNDRVIVDERTIKDTHDNIQEIINIHQRIQYLKQTELIKQFREIKDDTEHLLNIIKRSNSLLSFHLDEKINFAMKSPFKDFGEDALKMLDNYGDVKETSSFINFIRMFLTGDHQGNLNTSRFLENTARAKENTTKTITGIAAAGIVLQAAKEETDVKFLGTDLEKLLGQKEEHTVALTDTVNLMERMNAIFAKLKK